jgi:starch phosphorylase
MAHHDPKSKQKSRDPYNSQELAQIPSGRRTGLSVDTLKKAFIDNLYYVQGRFPPVMSTNDCYMAMAYTVRDRLLHRWISTAYTYLHRGSRTVCYLSAEFLLGPQLAHNLYNLGILEEARQALKESGLNLEELIEHEVEPGLGNGGLGRLAACYLDSLATLEIPTIGYGIRYEFGIFRQEIRDGWQFEVTDKWLRYGYPWEISRPEISFEVKFGGHTEQHRDEHGHQRTHWIPERIVLGKPFDTPTLGYRVNTANMLRLWKAEASEAFDFHAFNLGDYYGAVDKQVLSENITKVLYPNDNQVHGKKLRLEQQYFFVSCTLQDLIRIYQQKDHDLGKFHEKFTIQLNDTHPAIAIAELMRLLLDEHLMAWEQAWDITTRTFAYTNHTLLPEALEKWPLELFKELLPRHLEIIYEINYRFLDQVRMNHPTDHQRVARMSLIDESGDRYVRMANLACVGSYAINGVSELHTHLLCEQVLRDFYELWPQKFSAKTNGVTPRRFLALCNPRLTQLISTKIGNNWLNNLEDLRELEQWAEDPEFQTQWQYIKTLNKEDLAKLIFNRTGIAVSHQSIFDIQVKRMHEYKRQQLNILHIISLYYRLKSNPNLDIAPRTFIFGGKAAPGYAMAKLIIKLINSVADVINRDPAIRDLIKLVFFPNFNVKNAQVIYPAADLSEQISLAGKEASGTGNMKFTLNGALTIGTLDGANIEILEEVGEDNFFLFGLDAAQVQDLRSKGYQPEQYFNKNKTLQNTIALMRSGLFSHGDTQLFEPLIQSVMSHDPYMVFADFQSYLECQQHIDSTYRDQSRWNRMSILNVARSGKFSSDRSIREYCRDIWNVQPVHIEIDE